MDAQSQMFMFWPENSKLIVSDASFAFLPFLFPTDKAGLVLAMRHQYAASPV